MNPQPEYLEVVVMSFGFALLVIFYASNQKNHWKLKDEFVIAEWDDKAPPPVPMSISFDIDDEKPKKKKKRGKKKKKSKAKTKSNLNASRKHVSKTSVVSRNASGYTQLQQDCFDALKALGIKAVKERKFILNNTFNKHNPKTVQDFLKVALHRGV